MTFPQSLRRSCVGFLLFLASIPLSSVAQTVNTVAGGFVGDGRQATQASFEIPYSLVKDSSGNTYVGDTYAHRIRKISTTGIISTYAGTGIAGYNGDGRTAASAELNYPIGLALDPTGEIVIADFSNNRVRKVDVSGNITTIAGNGIAGYTGDGGPATSASLNGPFDLTYDGSGNLYISDRYNNVIRKVNTSGIISTYVAQGTLNSPAGLAVDPSRNLYVADKGNFVVRRVDPHGVITIFAGNGTNSDTGDGGPATAAGIGKPFGLSLKNGVLYIATSADSKIRNVVLSSGIIHTSIGSTTGYDGDGHSASSTELDAPYGVLANTGTNLLVVDRFNARLRQLAGGIVKTTAGGFLGDGGPATSSALLLPESIAFDSAGDLFIPDFDGNRIRKVDTTGKVSTVAGTSVSGYTGDGGPATSATLYFPEAVAVDPANNIFLVDQNYTVVRKIDSSTQKISSFPTLSPFTLLAGLAIDNLGNLYAADGGTCVIWKFDSLGNATVVAGQEFNCGYNGDNIPATSAQLNFPWGLTFDSKGTMYIADAGNNRVRRVNTAGTISTFAGNGTACPLSTNSCGDGGAATAAQLNSPTSVAVSGTTVYIADELDLRVRKVSSGIINAYACSGLSGYNGDGHAAAATNCDDPVAVAVNPITKNLYFSDDLQTRVRKVH